MTEDETLDFSPMFEPLTVGGTTLRNRFVMPGMQRSWCVDGAPSARLVEYYRRRAAAGTALIISESCAVDHPTSTQVAHFAWLTERTKEAWRACAEAVRGEGAQFLIQLWHEGALRLEGGDGPHAAHPTISPSGLVGDGRLAGRSMTTPELQELKAAFVRSALLAREIGATGVEVHAAHGYLLDQFLWKRTNRRADGYGGSDMRDRVRFPAEIVAAVRDAVGPDFVVSFRFSQWKEVDYDARVVDTPEELRILVESVEEAGADLLHVSTRRFWTPEWPDLDPDLGLAGWAKRFSDLPIAAVGSLGLDVDVMTSLHGGSAAPTGRPAFRELLRRFERGDFDLMTVGRGHIGDPAWVDKVRRGAIEEITPYVREEAAHELEELVGASPSPATTAGLPSPSSD